MFKFRSSTLPLGSFTLTRALSDAASSSVVVRLMLKSDLKLTSLQQNMIGHALTSNHWACLRIRVSNWY